ncbi:hypothetical protein [Massilia frigida]|uniref:hypothetical protein n=1 Tax=Massilia frigida TaxID=2609281 RepID=UPI0014245B09|nr:hypothetical protein [Massilia frigida]
MRRHTNMLLLPLLLCAAATSQAKGPQLASITDAQAAKIDAELQVKTTNKALQQAVAEAAPTIAPFLKANSCLGGYDASALNVYAAPGKTYPNNNYIGGPLPTMRRHTKGECATVVRIHGWDMPAKNALRFEVVYVSDSSGESGKSRHEVQRQAGGEWLFSK